MDGYKTCAEINSIHPELTESILLRAVKQGFFPGARRRGRRAYYLPNDEIKTFIRLRKSPLGDQIRHLHKSKGLMLTEDIAELIDVGVGYFSRYRKNGLLPPCRFESLYKRHVYHIDDVMKFIEKHRLMYNKKVAKKFGWVAGKKSQKLQPAGLQILRKRGVRFGN